MTAEELLSKLRAEIEIKRYQNWESENSYYDVSDIKNASICRHKRILCEYFLSVLSDLEKSEKPFKEPIDGVLYAAACGIKNKGQIEKSENPMEHKDIDAKIGHWLDGLDDKYCMLVNHYSIQDIKDTARYFAKWQKEQMMKELSEKIAGAYQLGLADKEKKMMEEAVEAEVESFSDMQFPEVSVPLNPTMFKSGDKVKLIIVKEEGKHV